MHLFSKKERRTLEAVYQETLQQCAPVVEKARQRGFRLATVDERQLNKAEDLYHWKGTLWVRLEE